MVVACRVVMFVGLALSVGACSGPSCVRVSDCPQGQSCIASSCRAPGTGAGGSAAGASGSASVAGTGGSAGQMAADAGPAKDAGPGDAGP